MSKDYLTTKDNFPVHDITHRPKRMQGDSIKSQESLTTVDSVITSPRSIPQSVTIEKAIQFYESHAEGEFEVLFKSTAKWLRDHMSKNVAPSGSNIDQAKELLERIKK